MVDPIQAMLALGVVPGDSLPGTSRYRDVGVATYDLPTQDLPTDEVAYFRRRLVPPPEQHRLLHYVQVREGDRRDLLAQAQLGDPAWWWRLADAQGVLDANELEEPPGRWIKVTLPADSRPQATGEAVGDDA